MSTKTKISFKLLLILNLFSVLNQSKPSTLIPYIVSRNFVKLLKVSLKLSKVLIF